MWVKWSQRKTGRRVSHLVFTFGEKPSEKPVKAQKPKTSGNAKGKDKNASGAIYGIPMALIKAHAKPGESESDAALRLLDEKKHKKAKTNG